MLGPWSATLISRMRWPIAKLLMSLVATSLLCAGCKPPPPAGLAAMQRPALDIDQLDAQVASLAYRYVVTHSAESREALLRCSEGDAGDLRVVDPTLAPASSWETELYVRQLHWRLGAVASACTALRKEAEARRSAGDSTATIDLHRLRNLVHRLAEANPDLFVPPTTPPAAQRPSPGIDLAAELAPRTVQPPPATLIQAALDGYRTSYRELAEKLDLPPGGLQASSTNN